MKERREKVHHHRVGFMKSQIKGDSDYVVSVSQWLPSTRIPQSDYTSTLLIPKTGQPWTQQVHSRSRRIPNSQHLQLNPTCTLTALSTAQPRYHRPSVGSQPWTPRASL
eukprot:3937039-Rhodomonas_salina.1